jgi:hypothetical protein
MHMNPKTLDADGIVSGLAVRAGDRLGLVGNYNEYANGTTYHLHFDMQVPTRIGWVFVNPYMSLVAAYEQLIGARGTEIKHGDAVPPIAAVPPVILRPSIVPGAAADQQREANAAETVKLPEAKPAEQAREKAKPHKEKLRKKVRRPRRKRRPRPDDDE